MTILLGILLCIIFAFYLYISWDMPKVHLLKTEEGLKSLFRSDFLPSEQIVLIPLQEIPPHVVNAFIAANDSKFRERSFFDGGIFAYGLSYYLFSAEKEEYDKMSHVESAVLGLNIALTLNKDEILATWLAIIYFGKNTYGISAASKKYFDKPFSELNLCEAAALASIPQAPSRFNPIDHPERAGERQQVMLERMVRLDFASKEDVERCKKE